MNRLDQLFAHQSKDLLNVYFTAGFPKLTDTVPILTALQAAGADLVEIGMPYSDPIADGETIQQSNEVALRNGMTIRTLFDQLTGVRPHLTVPVLLMGYLNPVMQFGFEAFCAECQRVGVDGLILPDLPLSAYQTEYQPTMARHGLRSVFLITPQTPDDRIRQVDALTDGFIYVVSSASVTGAKAGISDEQTAYFRRIEAMSLRNPRLVGFGVSDRATFVQAAAHAQGAIIGSAFIKLLRQSTDLPTDIAAFVAGVRGQN